MIGLRPHQENAVALLRSSLAGGKRRPLVQAPTGFGKTRVAAAIVERALAKGKRVLFTVPALSLVNQTVREFAKLGIVDIGVIQGVHELTDWTQPVQIASVQTLMRRKLPDCDIAIVDEAHKLFDFYGRWFAQAEHPIVGLSATPWTKGLGRLYDDLLIAATTSELIQGGYLSPFRVFAPSHPDLSNVRTVAGDYQENDLSEAMSPLVADVVRTWRRLGGNRPTLCFAVDRAHAKKLQQMFESSGVSTGYIDAYTPPDEREAVAERFHAGGVKVVVNVGCLTTGVDWDVRCIILARPTKSEILYCQIIGRGLRTADGKADCLILDHSDTTLRLGFVTDIHHEQLDDGKSRRSSRNERDEPLPKECPSCSFLKPPKVHACPMCGFKPERQSDIQCVDGELLEITGAKRVFSLADKIAFYGQLRAYAQSRGYARGWAYHKFIERFGVAPAGEVHNALPRPPTPETLSWIRSQQIRYAKRREAQHAVA
jgi:superfamily II DNA or RNA helicase